jgi:formylglycine-generating enzyme required for sulfatase activity
MTVSPSLFPTLVPIPAGSYSGTAIEAFRLGRTPVTNAEYAAHVERQRDRPFVLLCHRGRLDAPETRLLHRAATAEKAIGHCAKMMPPECAVGDPFRFGFYILLQLTSSMSPAGFDRPNQPVVNVSWFHAFEYCVGNGFFLPSDDQWSHAAQADQLEFATATGEWKRGRKKLAHFEEKATCDVNDPRYPLDSRGLAHMSGNVWEWTAFKPMESEDALVWGFGFRGGSYDRDGLIAARHRQHFPVADGRPEIRSNDMGFRVAKAR